MPQEARKALSLLKTLTDDQRAVFRPHQMEAIQSLVYDRKKVLLVQRTAGERARSISSPPGATR